MYKSFLTVLAVVFAALQFGSFSVSAATSPDGFEYTLVKEKENEIRIDDYKGPLTEVTIPETIDGKTVTTIYEFNSPNVTKVTIPKTVNNIYGATFRNMPKLAEVCFDGFNEGFVTVGPEAFPESLSKITFPPNITDWDVKTKMTLKVFPSGAKLYSGSEPLPHNYICMPADTEGQHYQKCTACDYVDPNSYEDHAGVGEFITDPNWNTDTNHFQKCKCGMIIGGLHEWEDGDVITPATCASTGLKTIICKECRAEKTEEIPKLSSHSYVNGVCSVCGDKDPDYTETEPTVTEPPVTEPPVTEPTVTEPTVTEPTVTEPTVTEPTVTEPTVTEPTVTEPPVTEPTVTEPVIIPPQYIPSHPTIITNTFKTSSKEPFIQGDNGKTGWEAISDTILSTPDGGTVTVNMNSTTKLPKDIVSQIQGRDITLVLDMGSGFVWTVNGMNVTKAKTVDMRVRKVSKIPKSVVDENFGDLKTIQIDLRHNGDFGFTAELTVSIGGRYDGMYANSYCYKSRKFEFGDSSEIVNGQAKLRFDHASSWLITVESTPVQEDVSSAAAAHSSGIPIDVSNSADRGINVPDFDVEKKLRLSNRKRRYRILRKRRLDDLVFVF